MSKGKLAVYGKDNEDGEMHLIKRGVDVPEAIELADKHYRETGQSAFIVKSEDRVTK